MAAAPSPRLVVQRFDPLRERKRKLLWVTCWLLSLVVLYVVCKFTMTPGFFRTQLALKTAEDERAKVEIELSRLRDDVARLKRSAQVDEQARLSLEATLAQSKVELGSLRSELAFYEKIVSGGAEQAGLAINDLNLVGTEDPRIFRFVVTLSQNLKKDRMARGSLKLAISGVQGQKLSRLDYAELGGSADRKDLAFEFKYFQRIEGTVMLPAGFVPDQVKVEADGVDGAGRVTREFAWSEGLQLAKAG
jgi:hypothetical protein